MNISTSNCGVKGLPEISFEVDDKIVSSANWLVTYFESKVESGDRFEVDQIVQIGWMLVQLREGRESLEIWEPDFDAIPIRWCRGVNNTLRHLTLQRAVCEALKCEPVFPSIRQAGITSPCFLESRSFTMSRDLIAESDSGWAFAERGYAGSKGEFISLYHIALQKMSIIPFLALPEKSLVQMEPGLIEVNLGNIVISSRDNVFLSQLASAPIIV